MDTVDNFDAERRDNRKESDMPVAAPAPQASSSSAETTLDVFLSLNTPETFRTELIDGEIVVTPPVSGDHETDISAISVQLIQADTDRLFDYSWNKGIEIQGRRLIPDLIVSKIGAFEGRPDWSPPDDVSMAVEVTSPSSHGRDRVSKRHAYAEAGIPLYLLIDRERRRIIVFSEPQDGDYQATRRAVFGEQLLLPSPFDFQLDTTRLT